jgi:hypothetical protein
MPQRTNGSCAEWFLHASVFSDSCPFCEPRDDVNARRIGAQRFSDSPQAMPEQRRFPLPWSVEDIDAAGIATCVDLAVKLPHRPSTVRMLAQFESRQVGDPVRQQVADRASGSGLTLQNGSRSHTRLGTGRH